MFLSKRKVISSCVVLGLVGNALGAGPAASTWTQGLTWESNTGQYAYHEFDSPTVDSAGYSVNTGYASSSGYDSKGVWQTMWFTGLTRNFASYTDLHSYSDGVVTDPYYNAINPLAWTGTSSDWSDTNYNPAGSPDNWTTLGFAGFNNTYTVGGNILPGDTFQLVYEGHGTNVGPGAAADMAVNIGPQDSKGNFQHSEGFFAFDPGNYNATWATHRYSLGSDTSISVGVFLSTQVVFNLNPASWWPASLPEGISASASSDFGATAKFLGISIVDANGNPVNDVTITDANGFTVPLVAPVPVPEPSTFVAAGVGLLCLVRRRRK